MPFVQAGHVFFEIIQRCLTYKYAGLQNMLVYCVFQVPGLAIMKELQSLENTAVNTTNVII